jgi:hypothetical protein
MSATARQADFITSLLSDRALPDQPTRSIAASIAERTGLDPAQAIAAFLAEIPDPGEASKVIEDLLAKPRIAVTVTAASSLYDAEPPEGIHYVLDGEGSITIYKVQRAVQGSGRLYAKRLVGEQWAYEGRRPFPFLSEATLLDLETARKYGHLYGVCGVCGRTLTDEKSIEQGIGPVCIKRFAA